MQPALLAHRVFKASWEHKVRLVLPGLPDPLVPQAHKVLRASKVIRDLPGHRASKVTRDLPETRDYKALSEIRGRLDPPVRRDRKVLLVLPDPLVPQARKA